MADRYTGRSMLPWSREPGESLRLGMSLGLMLVIFLPLALILSTMKLAEPERAEEEEIPPQLARLLEEPKPVEPIKLPEPEPEPTPEPEPEPEPQPEPEPEPVPEPEVAQPQPEPDPEPQPTPPQPKQQTVEQAREKASRSGLMAMQQQLSAMRDPEPIQSRTMAANVQDDASSVVDRPDRSRALRGSGGVKDQDGPVRDVELAGHNVQQVDAPVSVASGGDQDADAGPARRGQRGMNNIRKVFDNHKTLLFAIYNRELRQDPTLQGTVLLELVIEPDGSVSRVSVVSSELNNRDLEERIANRVRLFNFGEANVEARVVRFPIDFLPS